MFGVCLGGLVFRGGECVESGAERRGKEREGRGMMLERISENRRLEMGWGNEKSEWKWKWREGGI